MIQRMWINQPSTLQPHHGRHGVRVLAEPDTPLTYKVYFLSGQVISQQMPKTALSPGWPTVTPPAPPEPCGGCGEEDPTKACIGCLHFHGSQR